MKKKFLSYFFRTSIPLHVNVSLGNMDNAIPKVLKYYQTLIKQTKLAFFILNVKHINENKILH